MFGRYEIQIDSCSRCGASTRDDKVCRHCGAATANMTFEERTAYEVAQYKEWQQRVAASA